MFDAFRSAISGLMAIQQRTDVTANNIANVITAGFKKNRATIEEDQSGNPKVVVDRVTLSGNNAQQMSGTGALEEEPSNVDLGEEMADLIVSEHSFEANIKSAQVADDMLNTLINVKA